MGQSIRVNRPGAALVCATLLVAVLTACAGTAVKPGPSAGMVENPPSGIAVRIDRVEDMREFQSSDSRTLMPSLRGDGEDPARQSRVIGRGTTQAARPGANIFVVPDTTVEQIIEDATARALRQAGFRVIQKGEPGYEAAIGLEVDIEQMWMKQSLPTESPSTEMEIKARVYSNLPGLEVGALVETHERVVRGGFSRGMWRQVLDLSLDRFIETASDEFTRVVAAVNATPASQLAPTGLTMIPTEALPDRSKLDFGRYYLLAIGIDDYKLLPPLKTAVSDAQAVARLLEDAYGFETKLLLNATRGDLIQAFSEYRDKLGPRDNLLIYYAGHGWNDEEAGSGYWLPVDASADDETNWVSNSKITSILRAMKAKHVMVVSDSCYSGTLTRGIQVTRKGPGHLERLAERRTRLALASGGNEPVQDGGGGEHSVFANAFLRALRENRDILDATNLHSQIRTPVMRDSEQTPQFGAIRMARHEDGDFLFVRTD